MTAGPDDDDGATAGVDAEALFALFERAHMLELVYEIVANGAGGVRYSDLQATLDLSPNTLSRHLDALVEVGFLERTAYDEIPPRVEYEPTEKLYALEPTFRELGRWLEEYGDARGFDVPDV